MSRWPARLRRSQSQPRPGTSGSARKKIRASVVGHAITDDAHWSDHLYADGRLKSYDLGRALPGNWKVKGNELCMTRIGKRATTTECYEIWVARDAMQYRRDGVVVADGYLRAIEK